jgi:glyoxylase-like metal-dependent hydrolase (beta-lactamase superfamily II)
MVLDSPAPGVHRLLTFMVNVYFIGGRTGWILVDAGLRGYADRIRRAADDLFASAPPSAIVLTHGHFDHIGGLPQLAEEWDVPVYAHRLELPYLTGRSFYPPPDPRVGGGVWSRLSPAFPRRPLDLRHRVVALRDDGSLPCATGWRFIRTPGHTPGHVSLFRDDDRTLLSGDAVVTTKQESLLNVMTQRKTVWRPPAYFTTDWQLARHSVETLAALEPEVLASGHGQPMRGAAMRRALHELADHFAAVVPKRGRYVKAPALADERGVFRVPPAPRPRASTILTGLGLSAVALAFLRRRG